MVDVVDSEMIVDGYIEEQGHKQMFLLLLLLLAVVPSSCSVLLASSPQRWVMPYVFGLG